MLIATAYESIRFSSCRSYSTIEVEVIVVELPVSVQVGLSSF